MTVLREFLLQRQSYRIFVGRLIKFQYTNITEPEKQW